MPTTWAAAQAYLQRMYASGTLAVGQDGRAVGQAVLSPPLGPLALPLTAIVRFITRAWLPEDDPARCMDCRGVRRTRGGCRAC